MIRGWLPATSRGTSVALSSSAAPWAMRSRSRCGPPSPSRWFQPAGDQHLLQLDEVDAVGAQDQDVLGAQELTRLVEVLGGRHGRHQHRTGFGATQLVRHVGRCG